MKHKPSNTRADYTLPAIDKKRKRWQNIGFLRWHPEAVKILAASIIAVVVCIQLSLIFSQGYSKNTQLLNEGSRVMGTVVEKRISPGDSQGGFDGYDVTYTFSFPSGEQFRGSGEIKYQLWDQLDIGSPIEIAYSPDNPSMNLPIAADRPGIWIAYWGAFVFACGSFLLVLFILLPLVMWSVKKLILIFEIVVLKQ